MSRLPYKCAHCGLPTLAGDIQTAPRIYKDHGVTCELCGGNSRFPFRAKLIITTVGFAIMMLAFVPIFFIVREPLTAFDWIGTAVVIVTAALIAMFLEDKVASRFDLEKLPVEPGDVA